MKFFVDTAEIKEIADLLPTGLIDGVTTNPSLIMKSGRNFREVVAEICALVPGPVSAEVTAMESAKMIEEGKSLAKIAGNVVVKLPLTLEGLIALQVHSFDPNKHPQKKANVEVRWRDIRVRDLGRHVWRPIWDGKTLDGWTKQGGGVWSVEDAAIVARNRKDEPVHGHLFFDEKLGDFTVRLKYKALAGNSGFYFRTEKRDGNVGIAGFQAEIDALNDAGGLYETNGRGWVSQPDPAAVKKYFKPGEWNEMTVSARGRRVVIHVNGQRSAEVKDDPGRLEGYLALQLHGGQDVEVHFKAIELLVKE